MTTETQPAPTRSKTGYEDLRQVTLVGLAKGVELRYTPGGLAILEFTVAGQDGEIPFFQRVKAFGRYAERLADQGLEAQGVVVHGVLDHRTWGDPPQERLETVARRVEAFEVPRTALAQSKGGNDLLDGGTNRVLLTGRLTAKPELRYTPNAAAVLRMRVAVHEPNRTHFVTLKTWGALAEAFAEQDPQKGARIVALGRLSGRSYTTSQGERRYQNLVEATRLHLTRTVPARAGSGASSEAEPVPSIEDGLLEEFPPEEDLPF